MPPEYLDQVRFQATVLGLSQVQALHLQFQIGQQGLRLIEACQVVANLLTTYLVAVRATERRQIERQARQCWQQQGLPAVGH